MADGENDPVLKMEGETPDFDVVRFRVRDRLSTLFEVELEVTSADPAIRPADVLQKKVTFTIDPCREGSKGGPAIWHGIVTRFRLNSAEPTGVSRYLLRIEPLAVRLRYETRCQAFAEMSIKSVCQRVIDDSVVAARLGSFRGFQHTDPLTIQYNETDLDFVSRQLEACGVWYWFECSDGASTWRIDSPAERSTRVITLRAAGFGVEEAEDYAADVSLDHEVTTLTNAVSTEQHPRPHQAVGAEEGSLGRTPHSMGKRHVHHHGPPTHFASGEASDNQVVSLAKVASGRARAHHDVLRFTSNVLNLQPGQVFKLEGHPSVSESLEWVVRGFRLDGKMKGAWSAKITALPKLTKEPYHSPPLRTPWPKITETMTAVVDNVADGDPGYADRVPIKFHWLERHTTIWARRAWPFASVNAGMQAYPIAGDEVLVSFAHGELHDPVVVGMLHNVVHEAHFPANKHPHAVSITDRSGSMIVFEENEKATHLVSAEAMSLVTNGAGNLYKEIGGSENAKVAGDRNESVQGNVSLAGAKKGDLTFGQDFALESGLDAHVKAGLNMVLESAVNLTLKAGPSTIVLGPSGVAINGPLVQLNCPGSSAGTGKGASPNSPDTSPGVK